MGGGLSKKQKAGARAPPPAPRAPAHADQAHGLGSDSNGWQVAPGGGLDDVPYALLCPEDGYASPPRARARTDQGVPFDTPTGGAGVGSLRVRHLDEAPAASDAGLSEVPPTSVFVDVLEIGGLNDSATPGKRSLVELYCVAVIGTVTRVFDSQLSEGLDQVKFYGSRVMFPLHGREELQLIGLSMHLSVFLSSVSPTDSDRDVGECSVELERSWLFSAVGHTTWLRLVDGEGRGSAGRIKVSIVPEFGRGTVAQQDDSLLCSRSGSRLQDTLLDISAVRARSASPVISSSDDDTLLTDRSDLPFPPGAGGSSASSRKALISNMGLDALLEEVQTFNNHTQRMEWMRIVRAQHMFTCAQVLQILESLRYQHEVVQGCRIFAKSVTDPLNLHTLIQAVQAPNDRAEVAEYLTKVQQKNLAKMRRRADRWA